MKLPSPLINCGNSRRSSAGERKRDTPHGDLIVGDSTVKYQHKFKYYNFFAESFAEAISHLGLQVDPWTVNVILPVGISFYTFHDSSFSVLVFEKCSCLYIPTYLRWYDSEVGACVSDYDGST